MNSQEKEEEKLWACGNRSECDANGRCPLATPHALNSDCSERKFCDSIGEPVSCIPYVPPEPAHANAMAIASHPAQSDRA